MVSVLNIKRHTRFVQLSFIPFVVSCIVILVTSNNPGISFADSNNITQHLVYGCQTYVTTTHCDRLLNDLVSYKFSANSSRVYTVTDAPNIVPGKISGALEMVASNIESVAIPNSKSLNLSKFSVSFWIKKNPESEPYSHILSYTNYPPRAGWFFDMVNENNETRTYVRFNVANNLSVTHRSPDIPLDGNDFVNIVGVFNGTLMHTYANGKLLGITLFNGSYSADPQTPLKIGSSSYCSACSSWSGIIDDLKIYDRDLSENEIKAISEGSTTINSLPGLVAYYTFDNGLDDRSDHKNNGEMISIIGGMAFAPDGRLFFSEKDTGQIRIMSGSQVLSKPFVKLDDYFVSWEQGLLGIVVDPQFAENHFVYLYYTSIDKNSGEIFNRVIRFIDQGNSAVDKTVLLDRIFASKGYHSGGAMAFGPDDKLYITVGDATEHPFAQDLSISIGKVLRINRDGTIPSDNPDPNSPVYTYGHRNIFGIAFDKKSGIGIITENGDYRYDEINLIQKGGNYGFPLFQLPNKPPELANPLDSIIPLRSYWKIIAPTQAIYYDGEIFPELKGKFLFGTFLGDIYAIKIDTKTQRITSEEKLELGLYPFMPVVSISATPAGDIYFGGYSINKLVSLKKESKIETMDSIYVDLPSSFAVSDFQLNVARRQLDMSLTRTAQGNDTASYMAIRIPSSLLTDVYKVVQADSAQQATPITDERATTSEREIDFTITESAGDYTTFKIPLQIQGTELISIVGS